MSAILLRTLPHAATLALVSWRAMPGAYLALGRAPGPLPTSGAARLALEPGPPGIFRTLFWPLADGAVGFLTAIRLPDRLSIGDEPDIVLRGARAGDRDFQIRIPSPCDEDEFGRQLAAVAKPAAAVARFVLDLLTQQANGDLSGLLSLAQSFLRHAARQQGCIELVLEIPKRLILLQGWGPAIADDTEIVLGPRLIRQVPDFGDFIRSDVQAPLMGNLIALPINLRPELAGHDPIYLLSDNDLVCLRVIDQPALDQAASIGQIKHLLPRLRCPPTLEAMLRLSVQPHYEGADTLNGSTRPIRAALDIAVAAEGVGVFLSGWLLDPATQVCKIELCDETQRIRLDLDAIRVVRDDVLLAFKSQPSFSRPGRNDIGFAVFAGMSSHVGDRYLRFEFHDGEAAFMPLQCQDAATPGVRQSLCRSVDLHKPSGLRIIERHLAPFLSGVAPAPVPAAQAVASTPFARAHAVIVPLANHEVPRVAIANLLRDAPGADEHVIFVCGPQYSEDRASTLLNLIELYDLPAAMLRTREPIGALDAVLLAAEVSASETLLLTSPTASYHSGTRAALRSVTSRADVVCPTILYEDGSIRFAETNALDFSDRAPFASPSSPWLGLSAELIAATEPAPARGGTLECCLFTRHALSAIERARRFTTPFGQEAALFAVLQAEDSRIFWHPAVAVTSAEESAVTDQVNTLVENWSLRAMAKAIPCVS